MKDMRRRSAAAQKSELRTRTDNRGVHPITAPGAFGLKIVGGR